MKVLYIGAGAIRRKEVTGGTRGNARSIDMCYQICGRNNVIAISHCDDTPSKIKQLLSILFHKSYDIAQKKKKEIFYIIKSQNIDVVFLDMSLMGSLAKDIKKEFSTIKILSFFHNVEYDFRLEYLKTMSFRHRFFMRISSADAYKSEELTCRYSDVIMALNSRDAGQIYKYYNRTPEVLAPVCLKDEFKINSIHPINHDIPVGLMVGNNFRPNANGLDWFIANVLPFVKMRLVVVGTNMNLLIPKYKGVENLEIHGFVEDLSQYYADADYMICPIFEGAGMKVKTAEALEYGKYIFAGPEAIVGYEYTENEICVCKNAEEFINGINNFKRPKDWNGFIQSSRDLYLKNYSYDHSIEVFKRAFDMFVGANTD